MQAVVRDCRSLDGRGISIIYISHILEDVLQIADDIVVLRDGDVVAGGKAAEMTEDDLVRWMVGRQISQLYPDRQSRSSSQAPPAGRKSDAARVRQQHLVPGLRGRNLRNLRPNGFGTTDR